MSDDTWAIVLSFLDPKDVILEYVLLSKKFRDLVHLNPHSYAKDIHLPVLKRNRDEDAVDNSDEKGDPLPLKKCRRLAVSDPCWIPHIVSSSHYIRELELHHTKLPMHFDFSNIRRLHITVKTMSYDVVFPIIPHLKWISMSEVRSLDLSNLRHSRYLKHVMLSTSSSDIVDISPLSGLPIQYLTIASDNVTTAPLASLHKLKYLSMMINDDLNCIARLPLTYLRLYRWDLSEGDISVLNRIVTLKRLRLDSEVDPIDVPPVEMPGFGSMILTAGRELFLRASIAAAPRPLVERVHNIEQFLDSLEQSCIAITLPKLRTLELERVNVIDLAQLLPFRLTKLVIRTEGIPKNQLMCIQYLSFLTNLDLDFIDKRPVDFSFLKCMRLHRLRLMYLGRNGIDLDMLPKSLRSLHLNAIHIFNTEKISTALLMDLFICTRHHENVFDFKWVSYSPLIKVNMQINDAIVDLAELSTCPLRTVVCTAKEVQNISAISSIEGIYMDISHRSASGEVTKVFEN
jgi:hypothetical protein